MSSPTPTSETIQGLQLHGGYGYMREYPISTLFADARHLRWYAGVNEQLRLVIADSINPVKNADSSR